MRLIPFAVLISLVSIAGAQIGSNLALNFSVSIVGDATDCFVLGTYVSAELNSMCFYLGDDITGATTEAGPISDIFYDYSTGPFGSADSFVIDAGGRTHYVCSDYVWTDPPTPPYTMASEVCNAIYYTVDQQYRDGFVSVFGCQTDLIAIDSPCFMGFGSECKLWDCRNISVSGVWTYIENGTDSYTNFVTSLSGPFYFPNTTCSSCPDELYSYDGANSVIDPTYQFVTVLVDGCARCSSMTSFFETAPIYPVGLATFDVFSPSTPSGINQDQYNALSPILATSFEDSTASCPNFGLISSVSFHNSIINKDFCFALNSTSEFSIDSTTSHLFSSQGGSAFDCAYALDYFTNYVGPPDATTTRAYECLRMGLAINSITPAWATAGCGKNLNTYGTCSWSYANPINTLGLKPRCYSAACADIIPINICTYSVAIDTSSYENHFKNCGNDWCDINCAGCALNYTTDASLTTPVPPCPDCQYLDVATATQREIECLMCTRLQATFSDFQTPPIISSHTMGTDFGPLPTACTTPPTSPPTTAAPTTAAPTTAAPTTAAPTTAAPTTSSPTTSAPTSTPSSNPTTLPSQFSPAQIAQITLTIVVPLATMGILISIYILLVG